MRDRYGGRGKEVVTTATNIDQRAEEEISPQPAPGKVGLRAERRMGWPTSKHKQQPTAVNWRKGVTTISVNKCHRTYLRERSVYVCVSVYEFFVI